MGILRIDSATAGVASETAKLHQAMAQENYLEAKREADKLLQSRSPDDRLVASLAYGRILLSLGRKAEAHSYLTAMKRLKTDGDARSLLKIYELWLAAIEGDGDSAVKSLQEIVDSRSRQRATVEAADVLAQLYLQRGDKEKAKQAVEAGVAILSYLGIKDSYIETILRGRMSPKNSADPAESLFAAAEDLRQQKKFTDAGRVYAQVRTGFPKSAWCHPAGYRLGECLVELKRYPQAMDYWKAFLKELPAGPWRGQVHVAVIDLSLKHQFDLAVAAEHAKLAAAILDNAKDKTLEKSWQEATFEIRLRQGIIALLTHDYDAAVAALKLLKPLVAQTPSIQANMDRLIQAATDKKTLTPSELGEGMDHPSVLVVLGDIYNAVGRNLQALACCEAVLSGDMHGVSRFHRSLAALGMARAKRALEEREKAIAAFRQSLSEQSPASWHDDTLRELALLIEQPASEKDKTAADKAKTGKKKSACGCGAVHSASAAERAKQRAEAIPYWTDLTVAYPASRHVPEALFHIGTLYGETEQWQKALVDFDRLAREYPDSYWAGEAHVQLIDIMLERQFDLEGAQRHATAAIQWFEQMDPKKAVKATTTVDASAARSVSLAAYDIYVRAGLLEYIQERYTQANAIFEKAKPLAPPCKYTVVQGRIPTGIERLIEVGKSGKSVTPKIVREGDPVAKLILMLADIYLQGQEHRQSWCLCDRVIHDAAPQATREQRSWALLERGRNAYQLNSEDPDFASRICKGRTSDSIKAALADFQSAALTAPQADWASTALFLAANIQWNYYQDLRAATALWQRLVERYPKSNEAARSAYYVAVVYQWNDRPQEARRAFEEFLQQRPNSHLAAAAREHLNELAAVTSAGNSNTTENVPHKAVRKGTTPSESTLKP